MKLTVFFIAVLAAMNSCSDTKKEGVKYSDLRGENIKGDVSQMKISQYTCDRLIK